MTYQDRGGATLANEDNSESLDTKEFASELLKTLGWITIIVGFGIGVLSFANADMNNSFGALSAFVAVFLGGPIIVSGILLLAAASIVKSTFETARNTKKMLDIMQQ